MSGRSGKELTVEAMKDFIQTTMKDLGGPEIKFDADRGLSRYRRGKPLTVGELKALPQGAVVWVWYKQHDEQGPRIDGPMRATYSPDDGAWGLEDGSSFAAEFAPTGEYNPHAGRGEAKFAAPADTAECFDEGCGEGEMYLYHAVLPVKTPKKTKKGRSK